MKYEIIKSYKGHEDLSKLVTERMKDGWIPYGNPILDNKRYNFYQAMTLKEYGD